MFCQFCVFWPICQNSRSITRPGSGCGSLRRSTRYSSSETLYTVRPGSFVRKHQFYETSKLICETFNVCEQRASAQRDPLHDLSRRTSGLSTLIDAGLCNLVEQVIDDLLLRRLVFARCFSRFYDLFAGSTRILTG